MTIERPPCDICNGSGLRYVGFGCYGLCYCRKEKK
jgi:hypothetical protein